MFAGLRCTNLPNKRVGTALTEACYLGDMAIVQLLVEKGADVNCADGWALQTAAAEGHDTIIEELLRCGADINACTTNENFPAGTALQAACEAGNLNIVELLLKHNANPDFGAGPQTCPLIAAATRGEDEIVKLLINAKAKVNIFGGSEVGTPLTLGAAFLNKGSLELLLKAGADIDLKEADGDTALIVAARRGDKDCVQFLLEEGADIMVTNNNDENAIQCAAANVDNENLECLTILVNRASTILSVVKTAMDSGNTAVRNVVRSVDMQKPTSDTSKIQRRESNASFTANDEQIHLNARGVRSQLRGWDDDDADPHSMKIHTEPIEQFPQAVEDTSMIPPSPFPKPLGKSYVYSEQKGNEAQFTETGLESQPQDLSSSFTP
jgi:ankyrin repeat protein